ncbi:GTP-binding protein [Citromicrobium sp. RCC1885]|nr:GTP-binding protein [Citromicrobium sp. RCC1885]KPM26819.1 GTP-binding protein [Citromicrobium sp. RCC1878]
MRVQQVLQLSLTPVFLLAAIGAVMNTMTQRLIWIATRIEAIEEAAELGEAGRRPEELPILERRRVYAQGAVMFCTASALAICIVIGLLFVSAFIETQIGTLTAVAWITTMGLMVAGLVLFLLETRLATGSAKDRRRRSREIMRRKAERVAEDDNSGASL